MANNLNEFHTLGRVGLINTGALRSHLIRVHGISPESLRTKGALGRWHLMMHAAEAFPEIRELMGMTE